jgi:hypothetical protein
MGKEKPFPFYPFPLLTRRQSSVPLFFFARSKKERGRAKKDKRELKRNAEREKALIRAFSSPCCTALETLFLSKATRQGEEQGY